MFIALISGEGGGCKNSIACNKKWEILKATTWQEATLEVFKVLEELEGVEFEDEYDPIENYWIKSIKILEVVRHDDINISKWRSDRHQASREREQMKNREIRRAQFEELKREFGS